MMSLKQFAKFAADNTQLGEKAHNYQQPADVKTKTKKIKGAKDLLRRYNTTTPYGM